MKGELILIEGNARIARKKSKLVSREKQILLGGRIELDSNNKHDTCNIIRQAFRMNRIGCACFGLSSIYWLITWIPQEIQKMMNINIKEVPIIPRK